ncbi:MAG TPA: class I SAM-dependent methyltransferase [Actinophytocola sp.]|uniref:class I SAM-dependent methyltransferase n=1 Tax=Actinophytocola sp. TaxID=1872138 RepID=UPI002DDDADB4|nr:class I SAM-dependent methyltransferase [Actinophytocola sp.]HEV2780616.1 class I SAM-dependent methyltransferase [Actinophytocola sp.]
MSASTEESTVAALVAAFTGATSDRVDAEFHRLVDALWSDGKLTDLALPAASALVTLLDGELGAEHRGRVVILLGLLVEGEHPAAADVFAAVRAGLDRYLELLAGSTPGEPESLALLYLVQHFPDDRDRILAATEGLGLNVHDRTRLDRALAQLDPDKPDLGRVWPSPAIWEADEEELEYAQAWIKNLTPAQVRNNWDNDTLTVLGFSGALAYWGVRHGTPAPTAEVEVPPVDSIRTAESGPADEVFGRHASVLRCPSCHSALEIGADVVRCTSCVTRYPIANGILDLSAGVREGQEADDATNDLLQKLAEMPRLGLYYEAVLRPNYLKIAGSNWGDQVSHADEDAYIESHLRGVDGPVLDLAAGAGRWTEVVARTVGADRLIALDMAVPMLNVLRGRLPEVPAVMATALNLPFHDGSLGAINCWNALQAFPDDAAEAVAEMGRVLRPGGRLTMMTFRWEHDPIARYFQACQYFPSRPEGHLLFELEELRSWFDSAGLDIVDLSEVDAGSFVFLTAERR